MKKLTNSIFFLFLTIIIAGIFLEYNKGWIGVAFVFISIILGIRKIFTYFDSKPKYNFPIYSEISYNDD